MRKNQNLWGKAILIAVVLAMSGICLYALKIQIGGALLFFFLFPALIVILGKIAELIIHALEIVSTGPLSLTGPKTTILLVCYYASFSIFLALLIENSVILSLLHFKPNEWQVAIISLSLAFLPRVASYASGMERARNILLAVLTPLTLTAAFALFTQPTNIAPRLQTLELCVVGSLIQPIVGDLALLSAGFLGIIHPAITIETISVLDMRRLIRSQLETIQWDPICQVLREAKQVNRVDLIQKILDSMKFFMDESRKRGAKLARLMFIDALTRAIYSEPHLEGELFPLFEILQKEKEPEVRARVACGYEAISKKMPDRSLESLSELLDDEDMSVLQAVGSALTVIVKSNSKAISHAIRLSSNRVFLDWFFEHSTQLRFTPEGAISIDTTPGGTVRISPIELPILGAVKAAYVNSPDTVLAHIQKCSSNKDIKLRALAAAMVSDPVFVKNDTKLTHIREKLKKDKSMVIRNIVERYDSLSRLRWAYLMHEPRAGSLVIREDKES